MTPGARVAAAIEILDIWLAGTPVEKALTTWARGHRFAGSKDRAAIRDHVFDAVRCKRSCAGLGGTMTGRGLMIGLGRMQGWDMGAVFSGDGYSAKPVLPNENARELSPLEAIDCPDWLESPLKRALGDGFVSAMEHVRQRAAVVLRVNLRKADLQNAQDLLAREGIQTEQSEISPTALVITEGARALRQCTAYASGMVELQDAGSQAVCDSVALTSGARVLDYCAGGGGKTLALAAREDIAAFVHDANPARMRDLPARAKRAGVNVQQLRPMHLSDHAPFDVVLADVPCSGSGAWARQPEAKWNLTSQTLESLVETQADILQRAAPLVGADGILVYATCSLLAEENEAQVDRFLEQSHSWTLTQQQRFGPKFGCDGLFVAVFSRSG